MKIKWILITIIALGVSACQGEGGTETGSTLPTITASLKLVSESGQTSDDLNALKKAVGQGNTADLVSLKYYIRSITICEDMEISGTAFMNQTGCLELYAGANDPLYADEELVDYAPLGDVARGSDEGFVDLMDDTARATLNSSKTLTADEVRSYNYGFITWYVPIKLTAEVDMDNGDIFRTNDGSTATVVEGQGPVTTAATNFTEITEAQEAVVVSANGGSWFRFQNPFVVTQEDIDSATQYSLDLTFNPEGLIKAYSSGVGGCGGCILVDGAGNGFLVPMLDLTPVPHQTDESVARETYVATIVSGADNFDIRMELYSVEGDLARTIYGTDTATLINESTTTAVSPFPKVSFLQTAEDGTLEFQKHDEAVLISGFERQTDVGASFTATIHCDDSSQGGFSVDECTTGDLIEATFTLESITTLE